MKKQIIAMLLMVCLITLLVPMASAEHVHDASYDTNGRCASCGAYKPNEKCIEYQSPLEYTVKDGKTAYLRGYPYAASNEHVGETVWKIFSGKRVVVLGEVINGVGNKWYHVWFNGEKGKDYDYMNRGTYPGGFHYREGYIYAESLSACWTTATSEHPRFEIMTTPYTFDVSNETYPLALRQGQSFGLKGIIKPTSQGGSFIWNISAYIYDVSDAENMKIVPGYEYHKEWDRQRGGDRGVCLSYDIQKGGLDSAFVFNRLSVGSYVYLVRATNAWGPNRVIWSYFTVY